MNNIKKNNNTFEKALASVELHASTCGQEGGCNMGAQ